MEDPRAIRNINSASYLHRLKGPSKGTEKGANRVQNILLNNLVLPANSKGPAFTEELFGCRRLGVG